jgi:SMC interacting uncharacterized protein involved in chromosome segregation
MGGFMTEKRFKEIYPDIIRSNYCFTDNGEPIGDKEVVELLNEQHETIQSLISDSEKYRKLSMQFDNRNKELVSENALLEKENEQLKSKNLILKGKLHQLRLKCGKQEEEIECLSEETIEKFKQDLKDGNFIEFTAR